MKIKEIKSRNRRDFLAIYECESCGEEHEGTGYDDEHFHYNVVPAMQCKQCGSGVSPNYEPRTPRYREDEQI